MLKDYNTRLLWLRSGPDSVKWIRFISVWCHM